MTGPVDRSEFRHEQSIEADCEQIEVEQKPQQAHRQTAEGAAQQQQARVAAKTAKAFAQQSAAARLTDEQQRDSEKPDAAGEPYP